jgi:pimeloyl-ACP methyl ester carboxylesterase
VSRYFVAQGERATLDEQIRSELRGNFVTLSAGVTHYELRGPAEGDLVVLVPGLTIPLFYWDRLVDELERQGFRTLAYSAYGRGYSDRVRGSYDAALFVSQLADLLHTLELAAPAHLVASSMGALIALNALDSRAVSVRSVTLIGPAGLDERPPLPGVVARSDLLTGLAGRLVGSRALKKHLAHNVESPELAAALTAMTLDAYRFEGSIYSLVSTLQAFPLARQQALYRRVALLDVPIQLIWGADDRVTSVAGADEVQTLLHLATHEVHIIENCGHMVPFEKPATVTELVATLAART